MLVRSIGKKFYFWLPGQSVFARLVDKEGIMGDPIVSFNMKHEGSVSPAINRGAHNEISRNLGTSTVFF